MLDTGSNQNLGKQLGKTVKKLREGKQISQMELQIRAGLSNGYISKLENGKFESPSLRQVFNIANAFGMNLRDLLEAARLIPTESSFEGTLRAEGITEEQIQKIKEMKNFVIYSTKSDGDRKH